MTGIDISEPMLERARHRARQLDEPELELRQMDARELAFPTAVFDHVFAPYVISVVPEPEKVMTEIARVCKPGGTVIVVNHFHHPKQPVRWFEKALTPASQWLGFRLDVPIDVVTSTRGLRQISVVPVNSSANASFQEPVTPWACGAGAAGCAAAAGLTTMADTTALLTLAEKPRSRRPSETDRHSE